MNRLLTRLGLAVVIMGISWGVYQLSDTTDCSGPKSEAWMEASLDSLDEADADYQSWDDYTTEAEFLVYAQRAEARYQAQVDQKTIKCLEGLQEHAVDFFYYELEMYKAAIAGDWEVAADFDEKSIEAMDRIASAYDALASEYDWDEE